MSPDVFLKLEGTKSYAATVIEKMVNLLLTSEKIKIDRS